MFRMVEPTRKIDRSISAVTGCRLPEAEKAGARDKRAQTATVSVGSKRPWVAPALDRIDLTRTRGGTNSCYFESSTYYSGAIS